MKSANKLLVSFLVVALVFPYSLYAQTESVFQGNKTLNVAEYVSNNPQGEELIPVRLLGAVSKPGVYHIPVRSDLATVLSLAGGTTSDAKIDEIVISRQNPKTLLELDLKDVISKPSDTKTLLQANDIVFVDKHEPWISPNAVTALTVISTALGIVLSSIIISQQLNDK